MLCSKPVSCADDVHATGEREFTKSAHYITPVKKNVIGPSEAYTEEEYRCERRGESGFAVTVCAYNRKVGIRSPSLFWASSHASENCFQDLPRVLSTR